MCTHKHFKCVTLRTRFNPLCVAERAKKSEGGNEKRGTGFAVMAPAAQDLSGLSFETQQVENAQ